MSTIAPHTTRTVLAVNPSHASEVEHAFWCELSVQLQHHGWQLVQVAARNIPDTPGSVTVRLPARLWEFARHLRDRPQEELHVLPPWLSPDHIELQAEWERLRWETDRVGIVEGLHRLAWYTDDVLQVVAPSAVLTTNKIDHPCAFFRMAAKHHGLQTALIERSPFNTIWHEPDGLFGESTIPQAWRLAQPGDEHIERGHELITMLRADPAGLRRDEVASTEQSFASCTGPRVFVPLDNELWTGWTQPDHPQNAVDYPLYRRPQDAVDEIARGVRDRGGSAVFRPHPSCVQFQKLRLPAGAEVGDGDLGSALQATNFTIAFNSKLAFVSLAFGHETATLSPNPVSASGLCRRLSAAEELGDLLDELTRSTTGVDLERLAAFYGWLDREYFISSADGSGRGRTSADLADDLVVAAEPTAPPPNTSALQRELTRILHGPSGRQTPDELSGPTRRRRLVLELSRLSDPEGVHSGIARYGREVLHGVLQHAAEDFEIWVVVDPPAWANSSDVATLLAPIRSRVDGRLIDYRHDPSAARELGATLSERDVFHSIHRALPNRSITGGAQRILTVHDVLHVKHPHFHAGGGPPAVVAALASVDTTSDIVVCDSEQTRRDVLELLPIAPDRCTMIPLGVAAETSSASHSSESDRPTVSALLQWEARKNAAGLLAALDRLLVDRGADVELALMSSPRLEGDVESFRARHNGRPIRVDYAPSDEVMRQTLLASDVFVFASEYEGFGLPPLEAMACGALPVVLACSSLIEVCGEAAVYALAPDAEALCAAIERALIDRRSPTRRGAVERRAQQLTWPRTVAALTDLYRRG